MSDSSGSGLQGRQQGQQQNVQSGSGIQTRSSTGSLPEGGAGVERNREAAEFFADDKGEKRVSDHRMHQLQKRIISSSCNVAAYAVGHGASGSRNAVRVVSHRWAGCSPSRAGHMQAAPHACDHEIMSMLTTFPASPRVSAFALGRGVRSWQACHQGGRAQGGG